MTRIKKPRGNGNNQAAKAPFGAGWIAEAITGRDGAGLRTIFLAPKNFFFRNFPPAPFLKPKGKAGAGRAVTFQDFVDMLNGNAHFLGKWPNPAFEVPGFA